MNAQYCIDCDCPRLCEFAEKIMGVYFPRAKCLVGNNPYNDSHKRDVDQVTHELCERLREELTDY